MRNFYIFTILINPPQNQKQVQALLRAGYIKKNHTIFVVKYSFTHNVINLQFSSFAQPQSKSLLLFRIEWPEFQPTSNGSASTCLHKILLSEVIVDSVSQSASNAQHATEVGQL
jgi:hypothetical protein